jgi:STE24 endopeptidase
VSSQQNGLVVADGGAGLFEWGQVERARRYHQPLYLAALAGIVVDLSVLSLFAFGPFGDGVSEAIGGWPWWGITLAFALVVMTATALAELPLGFFAGFRYERAWGLSTQSAGGWFLDWLKRLVVGLVLGAGALFFFVAAARAWPDAWPLVVAAAAAAALLVLGFVAPLVLEPLFNRFQPLQDTELAASLWSLADRAGVPVSRVLVADASRRTRKLNAYVSGLGRTRRVVVYDTLLADADPRELQLVVAHELGHRRAHHVAKSTLLAMAGAALFITTAWALLRWPALLSSIGASGREDPRVIPFLLLLASVLGLLAAPFGSALSRRWERQADAFSLILTGDADTFESTHRRLALANLADLDPPRPIYLAWFTHPTPPERITAGRALALPAITDRRPDASEG